MIWNKGGLIGLAALAVFVATLAAQAAGLPIAKKTILEKSKAYDISVEYPQTGNARIDAVLAEYARNAVRGFETDAKDRQPGDPAYTMETTFNVERNDGKVFAVLFSIYTDEGGAHPNGNYDTFDFLLPDGAQVFLPEIVDGARGLKRVSDIVTADLIRRIGTGADSMSDADTIRMGAGPYADNFANFILEPAKIHIYFPAYQVAAYAAGPQEAVVPLSSLNGFMRSDWRAPAASFPCGSAKTAIEHAICSDAALARLDRQVSEAYAKKLRELYPDTAKPALKQSQRDFLSTRDKACGASQQMVACLTKSYAARLAALQKT